MLHRTIPHVIATDDASFYGMVGMVTQAAPVAMFSAMSGSASAMNIPIADVMVTGFPIASALSETFAAAGDHEASRLLNQMSQRGSSYVIDMDGAYVKVPVIFESDSLSAFENVVSQARMTNDIAGRPVIFFDRAAMVPPEVAQSLRRIITEGYAYLPVDGDPGQQGSWMRPDVNNADVKRFILAIARERDEPWRQEVMNMHGLSSDDAWMWAIEKARLTNRWRLSASLTDLVGISRELEIRKSPLASLTNSLARGSVSFPPCWTKHVSWNVDKADPFKCRLIGEIHMSSPSPAGLAYIVMDGSIRQDAWAIDFATKVARTGRKHGIFLILSKEWQDAPAVPFVGGFTARIADTQDVRIIGIGSEEETVPTMAAESMIARGHAFKSGSLLES